MHDKRKRTGRSGYASFFAFLAPLAAEKILRLADLLNARVPEGVQLQLLGLPGQGQEIPQEVIMRWR